MRTNNELVQGVLESNNELLGIIAKYEHSQTTRDIITLQITNNEMAIKLLNDEN